MNLRRGVLAALILTMSSAAVARAGVLYVPLPPRAEGEVVRLTASNSDEATARRYTIRSLALNQDGTVDREGLPSQSIAVAPRGASRVEIPASVPAGLLEIVAAGPLSFAAEVLGPDAARGAPIPVVTSESVTESLGQVFVLGLRRGEGLTSDVGLVNLGHGTGRCSADLVLADGTSGGAALVNLRPLSSAYFPDALGVFGLDGVDDVSLEVTCETPFFAYARIADETGMQLVGPAARGTSSLTIPGEASEFSVLTVDGPFHTASAQNPTKVFDFQVDAGKSYKQIRVAFTMYHGSWFPNSPSDNHSVFWLHRGKWLESPWRDNIYAFVNAFGPSKNEVKILTNVDAGKARQTWSQPTALQVGHTYRVEYVYDTATKKIDLSLTDTATGEQVVAIVGDTFGKPIVSPDGRFFIYFGHQDDTGIGPERPSYGSIWSDLDVQFVP